MGSKMLSPELRCMDPENYKKYFRALCWSGTRQTERPFKRRSKKDRRRPKPQNAAAVCYAPALLGNPSQFAVYATVRRSVLSRWKHVQGATENNSDESDEETNPIVSTKIPKITGIGLRTVFSLVQQSRASDSQFCERALEALLDVLQGHAPEELAHEPTEIVSHMHSMLIEVAAGNAPLDRVEMPTNLTTLGTSCLISLVVARGEAELILNAVASLIMSPQQLSEQYIQIPVNLTTLQRSVQSVILGTPSRNLWLNYGVPQQSLVTSFPVDLPPALTIGPTELTVRSLVSDGCFLYVFTSRGLLKIGSGYGSSIKQHVYLYKPDFFPGDRHGWLGFCKNKLYVRIGRKKTEVYELDKDTFEIKNMIKLDPGIINSAEPKSAVFSDGHQLGVIMLTNNREYLSIRFFDVEKTPEPTDGNGVTLKNRKEVTVPLLRKRNLALGRASYEEGVGRRSLDNDAPLAMQLDDNEEDPLASICAGQDFGLLATTSGRVYYTGKGASLGYKAVPHSGRWTLMKETLFNKNDVPNLRKFKVTQVAVGHEGVHAILVLDNGAALFTGIARRGEDGDGSKHRRAPKPTRPKKMYKTDGHHVVYAACNYGSTALVTRSGELLMFGKDTQHCDSNGVLVGIREKVTQVALGKAHAVVLTQSGHVYTLGINNKGQCGRELGYTKEKHYPSSQSGDDGKGDIQTCQVPHTWAMVYCRVCVLCHQCTGFGTACSLAHMPSRIPGERCGCGEGDSGCSECGLCRNCAARRPSAPPAPPAPPASDAMDSGDVAEDEELDTCNDHKSDKEIKGEQASGSDAERDAAIKVTCMPPARVAIPGGHKITSVACGLHHTMLLTDHGDVLTFGSNQFGQLGTGDVSPHHKLVKVKAPKATAIAAGSNHSAIMTRDGEVYTFGNYQKGALGRVATAVEPGGRVPIWYATPAPVPRIGSAHAARALWLSASGDQTYIQICQSVIKTETLFSSTIIANSTTIIILPNQPDHTFKCITINKNDGVCSAWNGPEQVDFVMTLACLDPMYDVLWCYQPQMRVMKCYNILAFDSHKLQRCCNPDLDPPDNIECYPSVGSMRRLEDFKNLENFELICNNGDRPVDNIALSDMSILNQELAIPLTHGAYVTRMHAAMHLLGCLDSLIYVHANKLHMIECKREAITSPVAPLKADYLTVTRFENHGGGWGYSGHSIEAIRFMCDTDILLGGYGLFGGRGDYTAKIKLYDIGHDGGDHEGDGELIAESEEVVYECAPRDRFPVMFDSPMPIIACRWYVALASVNGPSSDCGSAGQAMVISEDVGFHFKTSKKSNNGTDVNAGQIPSLLYNIAGSDHGIPHRIIDAGEPIITLTKNLSRKVTVPCFDYLITLLNWSWDSFKEILLQSNGLVSINFKKLNTMKHQKRLVYVIRACLRLVKSYVNEVYPPNCHKRMTTEYMAYLESIGEVKNLIQTIVATETPSCTMLRRSARSRATRVCYVQFALELTSSILKEAHETMVACFHAFFPTPTLKWNHLCSMLHHVRNGVGALQIRELTSTCAALCSSRSLRDVLHFVVPITQCHLMAEDMKRPDSKLLSNFVVKDIPASRANTVPRSAHSQKPPPIPPRANQKDNAKPSTSASSDKKRDHGEWNVLDVIPKFLDIVLNPIKQKMMTRQCGQLHDHGELKQNEALADYCCKLIVRIVAELTWSANNVKDMESATIKEMMTPSRFMRVNQSRSWNTGNGSPDAICFTVDRPGVVLVGVGVYSGSGSYEYSLELLHDMRQIHGAVDDTNTSNCWVSIDIVQGTFDGSECQNDLALIKFEKHVHLKEDLRYALRFCNHGGRTSNGDCGLPSVKGPDGTTFRFASCSLSFNGTTLARGQIPCIIYCGTAARSFSTTVDTTDALVAALHTITMRVSSLVLERSVELFRTLRNELTAEDLKRNISVLQQSPAVNTLIPYVLANLEGMDDSKNIIKLLEHIHQLLPHVTALNQLVPSIDECPTTTTGYYTWIESEHPYRQPSITNMRVLFPPNVSWIVLEMDPRSITTQPEDSLTIYAIAGTPKQRCHCQTDIRVADPPFRKVYKKVVQLSADGDFEELDEDVNSCNTCMHYNCSYVSVTPKLANIPQEWPQKALLVPGNEVIFALETASDYLSEYNKAQSEENRFGFRCLCAGYEDKPLTSQHQGLVALEMELVYSGSSCASKLLAPDLDVPPMVFSTLVDVHINPMNGSAEEELNSSEALLLSRGLELSSPLSVHQVLDGQSLLRCVSTERQFLMDFIAGAESTAGGRLACWLSPTPRVDPSKCEIKGPATPAHPAHKVSLPILVRDQYGDAVASPSLRVEVVIQKHEESSARQSRTNYTDYHLSIPDNPFQPPVKDNMFYQAISMMRVFTHYSFEELRLTSGIWGDAVAVIKERVPAERLIVKAHPDGTYMVNWTPKLHGVYKFRCTLDDLPIAQELSVEVSENVRESVSERGRAFAASGAQSPPTTRVARFAVECSAGLRVRASPSLQAEELGCINTGHSLDFIEELTNKDGTWVRLNTESVRAYTDGLASVAWCLKHHRHLNMTLLVAVDADTPASDTLLDEVEQWAGCEKDDAGGEDTPPPPPAPAPLLPPPHFQPKPGPSHDQNMAVDDSSFPYPVDLENDEDLNGVIPFPFAPEPSKRDRQMRNEAAGSASPSPRRSNGNEWWAPVRHRPDNGREVEPIPEADMEPDSDIDSEPELQHDLKLYRDMQQPAALRDARAASALAQRRHRAGAAPALAGLPRRRPYAAQELGPDEELLDHPAADLPPDLKPKRARPPYDKPELPHRQIPGPSGSPRRIPLVQVYRDQEDAYLEQRVREDVDKLQDENMQDEDIVRIPMLVQPLPLGLQDDNEQCGMQKQVVSVDVHARGGAGGRVAAGTQTSPVSQPHNYNLNQGLIQANQDPNHSSSTVAAAQRPPPHSHDLSAPPPLPARTAPAPGPPPPPPPPTKYALSPAQAECLRAVFAALLWHEGIVHDAIACAAFLKFHPLLPKQGAQVLTRGGHDASTPRQQRHSVEVSNAGNYLRIQPSTLESLTRSGVEASTSRARRSEVTDSIREEDSLSAGVSGTSSAPGVVNVLPAAMRALVALWDALYDSDHLSAATDKYKQPIYEIPLAPPKVVDELACFTSRGPPRVEWKTRFASSSSAARCELCGGASMPPPLASHMRHMHPGCGGGSTRGYDRAGLYKRTDPPPDPAPTHMPPSVCGQLMQDMTPAYQLWYIFCERCRDRGIKASSAKILKTKSALNSNIINLDLAVIDHNIMKENAIFLLDLAPLTNTESMSSTATWSEGPGRSPPTPPAAGSVWQPAPPFQCLAALGAAPRPTVDLTARYHSLGRPLPAQTTFCEKRRGLEGKGTASRVHRSVSMGQAGERDLVNAALPPQSRNEEDDQQDTLSGAGSSLLAQPSAELLRLVGCGETGSVGCTVSAFESPRVDTESLMKSPVLSFVLTQRDLPAFRQKLDAAIRISTVRQYAFEAMNWLMRSTTQPTCVHDVMWWFCGALDKYARLAPPPHAVDQNHEGEINVVGAENGPGPSASVRAGPGVSEAARLGVPTASTSAICPGGRSARGARAAFHAFLGSVSALAPSLPAGSPATLQAVRCWALHYSKHDRNFLHRSQVFNVISRILSHSEEVAYDDGFMATFNDSINSFLHKENYLWSCDDVTAWCDISVSSRQGMTGCLLDGSTETFWESGEEDRNKAKWIQVAFPGGALEDRPHIICVHIDNTRDTANKILLLSFLFSGGSGEMYHMQDFEVDIKTAGWICYTIPSCYPGACPGSIRVRCELRGPEPTVRARQVRVLSVPVRQPSPPPTPYQVIHTLAETDTLRVFRLLTSQVFGKLLEWEYSGGEGSEPPRDDAPADDCDLREHVVGILFAGHQLTCLQRQVMSHIVCAIGGETARVRDDWETAFICAEAAERDTQVPVRPFLNHQDNYCFEMLSLLLALSGSHVGRTHLAQQTELLTDLLALLHTGSDRVQRQIIFLMRRMMMEIPPQKMMATINYNKEPRLTLLDYLLCYLGKAINIQVKVKGGGGLAPTTGSLMMGASVKLAHQVPWFTRGITTKKHAQLVANLISDMAEDKISPAWGAETRSALAHYASYISQVSEANRLPRRCIALPTMWMTLAALCVCEQAHIELLNGGEGRDVRARGSNPEPRSFCANHDDGTTTAVIECRTCGALCAECDRFLHLNRSARAHHRQICKEEESAIRIDIHEGCGRAKLFWLLLLVDRRTLKGLAEFRGLDSGGAGEGALESAAGPIQGLSGGVCRFCGARATLGLLAIGNVCSDHQCQEFGRNACNRMLGCGHACGGVRGERSCLPCLVGCSRNAALRQDADDMCMICFTDPLQAAPSIQLGCGHVFHLHCCKKVIASRWIGPRITFSFAQCPICKENMDHWTVSELLAPINRLREEVQRKALMRFEYEGMGASGAGSASGAGDAPFDPVQYAMDRYAYYVCHKCEKAYFGGLARCEAESNGTWEPSELVCGACSDVAGAKSCPKHAADFLEYKCRYCCSVAVFFCFGTTHFCNPCHDDFQRVTNIPRQELPQCPAGPKCEQLPGSAEECPLHVVHPATGEEFALGCGVCRNAQVF